MSRYSFLGLAALFIASPALAGDTTVMPETAYILNSFLLLICGALVMLMAAGFAMLEAGLVRSGSVSTILLKNMVLYCVACVMFHLIGYNLMYKDVNGGFIGTLLPWATDESASAGGNFSGHSNASDWFFQVVFVATAASVVSGALAERTKLWPFLLFTTVLTSVIYPITGAWKWGGGWLNEMGFLDFAGSTLVHSVGGWAALTGVLIVGPRLGRFGPGGKSSPMPGSNLTLATLGTFILWFGWFGFNGGSQLAMGSAADINTVANVFVNTNAAAAGGAIAAMIGTQLRYKKVDLTMVLNGALAGLVSITAEPATPTIGMATMIGAIGGILVLFAVPLLDKFKFDDVVGAVPVHLVCGIWGTLAVPLTNPDASFVTQLIGVVSIGAFTTVVSLVLWTIINKTIGLRLSEQHERHGSDLAETGLDAYPEFLRTSQY